MLTRRKLMKLGAAGAGMAAMGRFVRADDQGASAKIGPENPSTGDTLALPGGERCPPGATRCLNWTSSDWPAVMRRWPLWKAAKKTHAPDPKRPLNLIVVHETEFDDDRYTRDDLGIHFVVGRTGTIYQPAPITKRFEHSPEVIRSIGIEVANGAKSGNGGASSEPSIAVKWRGTSRVFMPTEPQLQALSSLVEVLMSEFSGIRRAFLNAEVAPGAFLFSTGGKRIGDWLFKQIDEDPNLGKKAFAGVLSHSIMTTPDTRNDGGIPTCYTWLRIAKGLTHEQAWCLLPKMAMDSLVSYDDLTVEAQGRLNRSLTNASASFVSDYALNDRCVGGAEE